MPFMNESRRAELLSMSPAGHLREAAAIAATPVSADSMVVRQLAVTNALLFALVKSAGVVA
ncbi:hypothetical protein GCM10010123_24600 [Pilimelia anulata]|uniref:Uncharacterized protein n=1 Tax=Pilimelia anulata TaxID=53371 RepID=A0A8J3F8P0_9ACTN|nr:hypothetical protein [Pilimelia anulata]GGJ93824.1 hypothetical protein GCM10010123_24600 [Pilimelia anulata]